MRNFQPPGAALGSLGRIAFRNVLRNRRRSLITLAAVLLAVTVMVCLDGLSNGMVASIGDAMILGQSGALQIHRKGYLNALDGTSLELNLPADEAFLAKVEAVPGVKAVTARITFGAMLNAHDSSTVALFSALDPIREKAVCPRRGEMVSSGRSLEAAQAAAAVLTPELAASLDLRLGETATLLGNDADGALNAVEAEFVGSYGQAGLPVAEKKFGFVPLSLAQEFLRLPGRATEIAVAVHRLEDLEEIRSRIEQTLGPEFEVTSWRELAPWLDQAIATNRFMLTLLSFIFLFVALLGIVNTMLMSVFERTREVGTMMSVGARRRQVLQLFLLEAGALGFAGGALGAVLGTAVVLVLGHQGVVLQLANMSAPLHVHPWTSASYVLSMISLATVGAVVAALWPSLRASRMRPVQALASV